MIGHSAKSGTHFYYTCAKGFKQGKDACNAKALPKEKFERQVIEQLKSKVLTNNNLEELVKLVNEDLRTASFGLKDRMDTIDTELNDVQARLARLYDVLETGKLGLEELAPRIKVLKSRQDELSKVRLQLEAETIVCGVQDVDLATVKAYANDLRNLLEDADFTEKKGSLRSCVKRIEIDGQQAKVTYKLPQRTGTTEEKEEVLF